MNDNALKAAKTNINKMIDVDKYFPQFVFKQATYRTFFFDSDWIFDSKFINVIQKISSITNTSAVFFFKLDEIDTPLSVNANETPEQYLKLLQGGGPATGWLYDMGRYAVVSDTEKWAIYCERESEMAVISICDELIAQMQPILDSINAFSIQKALSGVGSYGFSDHALSPEWKSLLLSFY